MVRKSTEWSWSDENQRRGLLSWGVEEQLKKWIWHFDQ
jgi:hypothetical protein